MRIGWEMAMGRKYNWSEKALRRKTTGTGRMRYLRHLSRRCVAPEYASTGMLNEGSDVYSFGVLLMEIISGRSPVDYARPAGEGLPSVHMQWLNWFSLYCMWRFKGNQAVGFHSFTKGMFMVRVSRRTPSSAARSEASNAGAAAAASASTKTSHNPLQAFFEADRSQ